MIEACNYVKSLIEGQQSIEQVSKKIVQKFPYQVYELSKIINTQFFNNFSYDRRALCITLVCQILKKASLTDGSSKFVKGLAQRLRYFLQQLTRYFYDELRQHIPEVMALSINQNIEQLKQSGLFCKQYFQKLQILAKKILQNRREHSSYQKTFERSQSFEQDQRKYSLTFLKTLREISKNNTMREVYNTHANLAILQSQETNPKTNQQIQTRKQRLQKIIESCHTHVFEVMKFMKEQIKQYEENIALANLNMLDSHSKFINHIESIAD